MNDPTLCSLMRIILSLFHSDGMERVNWKSSDLFLFESKQFVFKMKVKLSVIILTSGLMVSGFSQVPEFKKPVPASMAFIPVGSLEPKSNNIKPVNTVVVQNLAPLYRNDLSPEQRSRLMIEQDMRNYNANHLRSKSIIEEAHSVLEKTKAEAFKINYSFPISKSNVSSYENAFNKHKSILNGQSKYSLLNAVFATESAFLDNQMSFKKFDKALNDAVNIIALKMQQDGNSRDDQIALNMAIFEFMTDTINIKTPNNESTLTHYPMKYDFEDPWGRQKWEKQLVSKLLTEFTGQCHSLPLLYMLLAEKLGANAHLSYAPQHSYIKFSDGNGNWYNAEMTNGMFTTDNFIANSGYVKVEAIANRLYMDTLSTSENIVHSLVDLANGYQKKFGYDEFYIEMVESALGYHPNNVFARMMQANYYTELFQYISNQHKRTKKLEEVPQALEIYNKMVTAHKKLEQLGYEDIPLFVYNNWLKQLEDGKNQTAHLQKYNLLKGTIEK